MKKKLPFSPTPQASFQLVETFIAYSSSQRGGGLLLDRKKRGAFVVSVLFTAVALSLL